VGEEKDGDFLIWPVANVDGAMDAVIHYRFVASKTVLAGNLAGGWDRRLSEAPTPCYGRSPEPSAFMGSNPALNGGGIEIRSIRAWDSTLFHYLAGSALPRSSAAFVQGTAGSQPSDSQIKRYRGNCGYHSGMHFSQKAGGRANS
jgi:hypothetical protein